VYGRTLQSQDCAPVVAAAKDPDQHVVLAALDALGNGCPGGAAPLELLVGLVDALPERAQTPDAAGWHAGAHAFVSLAKLQRETATPRLARVAEHRSWQVRVYAARGATELGAAARLERLATDPNQNVRHAAVAGLRRIRGHEADAVYLAALRDGDHQLVLEAAQALAGSPSPAAAPALVEAFARLTGERRETSRDPRVAILERLRELGTAAHASRLQSCLADFDPVVAQQCATTLRRWTGAAPAPKPITARPAAVPQVLPSRARIVLAGGAAIELRLLADDAPASVARFVRLARQGYYDRLDMHRVVPNFVVQGGSPGANEYAGDGAFMRDELGLVSNVRGTLGVSTRGRDTGDAQFFINLLDNPRLDHDYTVFAQVAAGMDVVDRLLEGDVIERVEVP
jgi:cyclophilin family peptidyl-prolyl cis-trans isomerase/HEAT repeat protein